MWRITATARRSLLLLWNNQQVNCRHIMRTQNNRKLLTITDHYDFDKKVINSKKPVIVNFHAEWCEPCKILTPKMLELLTESETIDLAVIDVETSAELVETFEVKAVPAVLAFRNGVIVDKFIGLDDSRSIETVLAKLNTQGTAEEQQEGAK